MAWGRACLAAAAAAFLLAAPLPASSQAGPGAAAPAPAAWVALLPGYSTAYGGGATVLALAGFPRADRYEVEVGLEVMDAGYRSRPPARIAWIGLGLPRRAPMTTIFGGVRAGILKGPYHDGGVGEVHAGLRWGERGLGARLEAALLAGSDGQPFLGGRLVAGVSWTFR